MFKKNDETSGSVENFRGIIRPYVWDDILQRNSYRIIDLLIYVVHMLPCIVCMKNFSGLPGLFLNKVFEVLKFIKDLLFFLEKKHPCIHWININKVKEYLSLMIEGWGNGPIGSMWIGSKTWVSLHAFPLLNLFFGYFPSVQLWQKPSEEWKFSNPITMLYLLSYCKI